MSNSAKPTRVADALLETEEDLTGVPVVQTHTPAPESDQVDTSAEATNFVELRAGGTLVAIEATQGQRPVMLYCGPDIPGANPAEFSILSTGQHAPGGASVHLRGSLMLEIGTGSEGPSGLVTHRDGHDWAMDLRVTAIEQTGENAVALFCQDANTQIEARHDLALDKSTGVLRKSTTITNIADAPLDLDWCAALCLPLDQRLTKLRGFTGRWSNEFQIEEVEEFRGSYVRENKSGRTSHGTFPGIVMGTACTNETSGLAAAFHLGWSGNSRVRVDRHNDGRSYLQMGEMSFPGEFHLANVESYTTPDMYSCWSNHGMNDLSDRLHRYYEAEILDQRAKTKPRPVHYNTWEAVYFDHTEERLIELAEKAAEIGAERFVLDDGWFGGRRHESAGLGDWWVSPEVYPDGLHRLVDKVHELGMEFGLWFEPEMVNPDSDLYRAHPEWVLQAEGVETIPFRQQLTLDLTRPAVFDYLFEQISAVVSEYKIAYIKWDMNRDTNHPGSAGRGAMHRQTQAVYRLLQALRDAFPKLEIESCSSGGGRADYGVLRHADRIWTSDNNDARARQLIQRGASHFFPLRITGSHVGPRRCHITGRVFTMEYRVATAVFGHMGMELDLLDETDEALDALRAGIALYKQHRELIHQGKFVRIDSNDETNMVGCVAHDRSEALMSYAQICPPASTLPARMFMTGLDPQRDYLVRLVWPTNNPSVSSPSIMEAADLMGEGTVLSGGSLMNHGIQPPLVFPDTCLIYHLKAV